MGEVFLVRHIRLNSFRAIKKVPKKVSGTQWKKETELLKNLRHPNIPVIFDIEEDEDFIYIIEEFVEGQSLKAFRLSQKYIQESRVADIIIQLCEVLHYLHSLEKPILYLDLKPDNILFEKNTVKLIDFSAALFLEREILPEVSYGTKGFAAPEQYKVGPLDERSDVYGLGGILYYLFMGTSYGGAKRERNALKKNPCCSLKMYKAAVKCLAYAPEKRYRNVIELKEEVIRCAEKRIPLFIAAAGMIPRIGTTHICLMLCAYLRSLGKEVLYLEQNENRVLEVLLHAGKEKISFPVMRGTWKEAVSRYPEIHIIVSDCGSVFDKNPAYDAGDKKLLICGCKPWEDTNYLRQNNITYLFNFTTTNDFLQIKRTLPAGKCVQIPFDNNYLSPKKNKIMMELCQDLLKQTGESKVEGYYVEKKS